MKSSPSPRVLERAVASPHTPPAPSTPFASVRGPLCVVISVSFDRAVVAESPPSERAVPAPPPERRVHPSVPGDSSRRSVFVPFERAVSPTDAVESRRSARLPRRASHAARRCSFSAASSRSSSSRRSSHAFRRARSCTSPVITATILSWHSCSARPRERALLSRRSAGIRTEAWAWPIAISASLSIVAR